MYFDAHLHLIDEKELLSAYQKNIKGFIINATKENEWEKIISLSKKYTFVQAAIGVHPWFIETASPDWQEKMALMLQNNPSLMIGEIGLDGLKDNIKKQEEIFLTSLCLAQKFKRSVHIHAVKSWDKILSHLKEFSDVTYLFHRFNGSKEIIQELKKYNCWFSLYTQKNVEFLPIDKVLTETDCNQDIYPSNQLIQLVDNFTLPLQQIEKNFYNFIKKSEN